MRKLKHEFFCKAYPSLKKIMSIKLYSGLLPDNKLSCISGLFIPGL